MPRTRAEPRAALGVILGSVASIRCLGSNGADADAARTADGARPLHVAAGAGRRHALRALVRELSASVEARDGRGRTAMHWACRAGDVALLCSVLKELGASVDARAGGGSDAADAGSEARARFRVPELVDDLGAGLCNLTDEDGATATHRHAAAHGRADALAVLPPVADALHVAAANNSRDVIERLVDGGVAQRPGRTSGPAAGRPAPTRWRR